MKKTLIVLLMVLLSAMLIISCDGDAGGSTTTPTETPSTPSEPTTPSEPSSASYKVTFILDGGTGTFNDQTVTANGTATKPTEKPTKADLIFNFWSKDGTSEFNFSTPITGDTTLTAVWRDYYIVGDTGPAGGIIFYVADTEQTSTYIDSNGTKQELKWRYLEAATANLSNSYKSGLYVGTLGTGTGIGYGWINAQIFNANTLSNFPGAEACANYGNGTNFDDWFLPSKEELELMFTLSGTIGGFEYNNYLTSSEYGAQKWYMGGIGAAMDPGCSAGERDDYAACVRPIRAFNSTTASSTTPSTTTYHTVTFNTNGGTSWSYVSSAVADGEKLTKPATAPKKLKEAFLYWSKDGNTEFDFDTAIRENIELKAVWKNSFVAGDTGPAGGIIIYAKTVESDGWTYLEAATTDLMKNQYEGLQWSEGSRPNVTTDTAIGKGKSNTAALVAAATETEGYPAAEACDKYVVDSIFTDWFLPSKEELIEMRKYKSSLSISEGKYWSSSLERDNQVYTLNFADDSEAESTDLSTSRMESYKTRPVRAF